MKDPGNEVARHCDSLLFQTKMAKTYTLLQIKTAQIHTFQLAPYKPQRSPSPIPPHHSGIEQLCKPAISKQMSAIGLLWAVRANWFKVFDRKREQNTTIKIVTQP